MADGTTFSDGGLDAGGRALSGNLLGTSVTLDTVTFDLGPVGANDVVSAAGQTIALPSGSYGALMLLATGVNGNQVGQPFTVTYTDATQAIFTQSISDWYTPQNYSGESTAVTMSFRDKSDGTRDSQTYFVYAYSFNLNATKTVSSITLPNDANVEVLAIDLLPTGTPMPTVTPSPTPRPSPTATPRPTATATPRPTATATPTPTPPPQDSLGPPAGYTSSQLIFDDNFLSPTLDSTKWIPQIADQWGVWRKSVPAPYSAPNAGSYNVEYYDPYPQQGTNTTGPHVVTGNGLRIIATPSNRFPGYTWAGGAITTHGLFYLPGGYVQFRAKMPDSRSGMWGCLWFLEGGGEIDLQESGYPKGSANVNNVQSVAYHGGGSQILLNTGVDLSAAYHTYGMEYIPGHSIKMYLDGALEATYTQNIPTGAYEILINLQVAGSQAAGWHTVAGSSGQFELDVSEVQAYKLR